MFVRTWMHKAGFMSATYSALKVLLSVYFLLLRPVRKPLQPDLVTFSCDVALLLALLWQLLIFSSGLLSPVFVSNIIQKGIQSLQQGPWTLLRKKRRNISGNHHMFQNMFFFISLYYIKGPNTNLDFCLYAQVVERPCAQSHLFEAVAVKSEIANTCIHNDTS